MWSFRKLFAQEEPPKIHMLTPVRSAITILEFPFVIFQYFGMFSEVVKDKHGSMSLCAQTPEGLPLPPAMPMLLYL